MYVSELTRNQLINLKCAYMCQLADEGLFREIMNCNHDGPSYEDLANADNIISDSVILEHYQGIKGINFSEDDFIG